MVVSGVPGKRTADKVEKRGHDCKPRTGARPLRLLTSEEYPASKPALLNASGQEVVPPRTGKPGRPKAPYKVAPPELQYTTVHKTREKGRVVEVDFRVVCGTVVGVRAALAQSVVSTGRSTPPLANGKTGPTVIALPARCARATVSRRTGTYMKRSPTSPCTAITSAGRYEHCV